MRFALPIFLAVLLVSCAGVFADTRVELLGRAADNGFRFYSAGTPWSGARVGEYVYTTFTVTGAAVDITQPMDHTIQPLVQANVFNIVPGSFTTRLSDIAMDSPVVPTTDPIIGPITNPAALLAHFYYQVDTLDIEGVFMPWAIGSCCFPDGSCSVTNNAQCVRGAVPGAWTTNGTCETAACVQPNGACCAFDDSCSITSQANCSGSWTTGGVCEPGVTCPQFAGACCSTNGSCAMTVGASCAGPGQVWASGSCQPNPCQTLLIPGYVMNIYLSHLIPRITNSPVAWSTADFASITGTYPGSLFDGSRSWLIEFVGTDHLPYEMFVDIQRLVISTDTTATGSCCPGDGRCIVGTQAICPTTAWTSGGSCDPSPCPTASGACCYANGTCDLVLATVCAGTSTAVYQGDGTSCTTVSCGATGACCTGGSCTVLLQGACASAGGSWLGAGTTCAVLPQQTSTFSTSAGSCCSGNVCSVYSIPTQCSASAVWRPGTTCDATVCGANGACCNNTTGACVMATNGTSGCASVGGTWMTGVGCSPTPCASTGACCNTSTSTCSIKNQASCLSASGGPFTWTDTGTCSSLCGTGKCCSSEFGACSLETQAGCVTHWGAANMSWTAGEACATACVVPMTPLQGPATTPQLFPITVSSAGTVSEVEVWLDVSAPSAANMYFELVAPNGASVSLVNRIGASNCTGNFTGASASMFGTYVFLDSAAQSIAGFMGSQTSQVPSGSYKPAGCGNAAVSLNASFAGLPLAGDWKLRTTDYRGDLRMFLRSWGISFNGGNPAPCTVGHCNLPQGGCSSSTYAQCVGSWSVGPCSATTCSGGAAPGACCYLNTCTVICQSQCPSNSGGGRFAGTGTACTAGICNVACCQSSGACTLTTVANCPGTPGVTGSICSTNTCPQPAACCGVAGACTLLLPSVCSGTVGSSTCTPNTCPGQLPAPLNDVCGTVLAGGGGPTAEIVLSGGIATINETLLGATSDGVSPTCAAAANDVWYRFTPPTTANYLIKTCGTSLLWDSVVSVWSNCTTQVAGACGDTGCSSEALHASLTFPLTEGTPYLIRVGAYSLSTPNINTFRLEVQGLGACCIQTGGTSSPIRCFTGACVVTSVPSCNGVHQGLGTACTINPCPQEYGRCCRPDGSCFAICADFCHSIGGFFGVVGTTCSTNDNPCPIGTCCRGATCTAGYPQVSCVGNYVSFVSIEGCNAPGNTTTPCCYGDYNKINGLSVQDIFDFLNDWFAGSPYALTGGNGEPGPLSVQNIFDFLNAWFAGGC